MKNNNKIKKYHNPVGESKYTGLFLVMPFIVGFFLLQIYPFVVSFVLSFTKFSINDTPEFIGFKNFKMLFSDSDFWKAFFVTFKYVIMLVPLKIAVSLLTALMLSTRIKGMGFFRTLYYIPSILGSNIAIVIMWSFLFTSEGLVNQVLDAVGISKIGWYGEETPAMWIIVFLRVWEFGSTMIIFLSAINDIPRELYDSARTDGAGNIKTFFYITLPMLKNAIFLNLILQMITAFQEFNAPFLITGGNPLKGTYTVAMMIYDESFKYYNIGYASALSWVLFVVISLLALLIFKFTKKIRSD